MDADGTNVRTLIQPKNTVDVGEDLTTPRTPRTAADLLPALVPGSIQLSGDERRRYAIAHELVSEAGPGWDGVATRRPMAGGSRTGTTSRMAVRLQHVTVVRADGTGPLIETGPALTGTAHWAGHPIEQDPDDGERWQYRIRLASRPSRWALASGSLEFGPGLSTGNASRSRTDPSRRPTAPFTGQERTPGGRARGSRCMRLGCGERIRTSDLRVMSPTSCRCSTPRLVTLGPKRRSVKRRHARRGRIGFCGEQNH